MAVVIHTIKGNQYAYEHHRVGDKIVCDYLGVAGGGGGVTQHLSGAYSDVEISKDKVVKTPKTVQLIAGGTKKQDYEKTIKIMNDLKGIRGVPKAKLIDGKLVEERMPGGVLTGQYYTKEEKEIIIKEVTRITDEIKDRGYLYFDVNTNNILYDRKTKQVSLVDYDPELVTPIKSINKDDLDFEIDMFKEMRSEINNKIHVE